MAIAGVAKSVLSNNIHPLNTLCQSGDSNLAQSARRLGLATVNNQRIGIHGDSVI